MAKQKTLPKISLRHCTLKDLEAIVEELGGERYRAKQLNDFLFQPQQKSWEDCKGLPKSLLEKIKENYLFSSLKLLERIYSEKDNTTKYLFETQLGEKTESVIIRKNKRITACLSSQVGCKFACRFCVSGSEGLFRHMDACEIIDQFFIMQQHEEDRITNLVMMGMGEPFDNYEAMIAAVKKIHSSEGFHLGARHITISTVGVPNGIAKFAKEGLDQIKLAWSLHGADDVIREKLMPINKKWNIEKVIQTFEDNLKAFKRSITFEYILFKDINDSVEDAKKLAKLAKRIKAKINLIRYNPTGYGLDDQPFRSTGLQEMQQFREVLDQEGVVNTLRKSGGSDVGAACGQLSLGKK